MNPSADDRNDQPMSQLLSITEREAAAPDEAFLLRLRERSTEVFIAASGQSPSRVRRYRQMIARNSKWLVPAAVAAAVALVLFGVWPAGHADGRVYAMTDVPDLIRSATTLHIKGREFVPPYAIPGREQVEIPFEYWVDSRTVSLRETSHFYSVGADQEVTVTQLETVSDGKYSMHINHTNRTVRFSVLSDFQRKLQSRSSLEATFMGLLDHCKNVGAFTKVGQETLQGSPYDVWEGVIEIEAGLARLALKSEWWLDPASGQIARLLVWARGPFTQDWAPVMRLDAFERNVEPPAGIFETTPPPGYTLENTKATAEMLDLQSAGGDGLNGLTLVRHIAFKLDERAVLLGWSSTDKNAPVSQADLFADLEVGGPVPKLPIEVYALARKIRDGAIKYSGRHLAFTCKGDKFYEWSLYVATKDVPPEPLGLEYRALYRLHPADGDERPFGHLRLSVGPIAIDAGDFDEWVRGAMAELSDDGAVPEHVTYENVLQLIEDIRAALEPQPSAAPED